MADFHISLPKTRPKVRKVQNGRTFCAVRQQSIFSLVIRPSYDILLAVSLQRISNTTYCSCGPCGKLAYVKLPSARDTDLPQRVQHADTKRIPEVLFLGVWVFQRLFPGNFRYLEALKRNFQSSEEISATSVGFSSHLPFYSELDHFLADFRITIVQKCAKSEDLHNAEALQYG